MSSTNKKILIISYNFPPQGGVKIQRVIKLIKYLPEHGYEAVVLAPKGEMQHSYDPDSLDEIKDKCQIVRARTFEITKPLFWIRNLLRRLRSRKISALEGQKAGPRSPGRVLVNYLFFPDIAIFWLPAAIIQGFRIIRKNKISAIFSTSPPFSCHLIAMILSKIFRIPHVVDMRDLWIDNPFVQLPSKLHLKIGRRLEQRVLSSAARTTTVTSAMKGLLEKEYLKYLKKPVKIIDNGYDPEDFSGDLLKGDDKKFNIVHVGSILYASGRSHQPFTESVIALIKKKSDFARDVRLDYYGFMDAHNLNIIQETKNDIELAEKIIYHGPVSHKRAIQVMRSASLLLLIAGHRIDYSSNLITKEMETDTIAAKLYEYLAAEKPIFLIANECPAVEIALACKAGFWCDSYDPEVISEQLLELYEKFHHKKDKLTVDRTKVSKFSRQSQAKQFAEIFAEIELKSNN